MNNKIAKAHLALFAAGCLWGLMSPVGKLAMDAGISGISLAAMRMIGGAVCFWTASLFAPKEKVAKRDFVKLFFAALLAIVFNQGLFILGLSLTSPVDATIITTSLPIITLILAALFLKEPATPMKIAGVVIGAAGALILIISNHTGSGIYGNVLGDLFCLFAQISFACYLTIFRGFIGRYHILTLMKWMFTYAALCFIPLSWNSLSEMMKSSFPSAVWLEIGYVVLFGTFFAYLLIMVGQKTLRPTLVSMYNYVQPIVGTVVSVWLGVGSFGWMKAFASVLIFIGVYIVTQSKSREQYRKEVTRIKS
ncbi:DMT family transporter [Limibacterium fermenti]|uniref:DMT family transporter n=1 Tax=Limibacterium fermenti TaxID=3229863 RepID=UPI000E84EF48|nr:EamA family transporter [Porphyromonadaceae bacterium]